MSDVQAVPDGYQSVTPYLTFQKADAALRWYEEAFGARELARLSMPSGGIAHAESLIGNSRIMVADESPMSGNKSAETLGDSPVAFMIYVEDVDAAFARAVQAGAAVVRPIKDQFYGDRSGTLRDPFGYQWTLATHVEDVSLEEMRRRFAQFATA